MEAMAKNMGTITSRLDLIEKGTPSLLELPMPNTTLDKTVPPLMSHKVGNLHKRYGSSAQVSTSAARPVTAPGSSTISSSGPPTSSARPLGTKAAQPILEKSANTDFSAICKALNRTVQIRRHITNWKTLPSTIERNLQHMAKNIRPVHPSDQLTQDISDIFHQTGLRLRDRVQQHFDERLESNLSILRNSQPLDKDRAVDVVTKQLLRRLGSKVTEPSIRPLVEKEGMVIGKPDTQTFSSKSGPKKKLCLSTSPTMPTSFASHNPFSVLATVDDVETASPSPPRKQSLGPPTTASSLPSTPQFKTPRTPRTAAQPPTAPFKPTTSPSSSSSSSALLPGYTYHAPNHKSTWGINLRPDTRSLIISDSNFKFIKPSDLPPTVQLDCFSGATFTNALKVIEDLPAGQVDSLVVAIGINHKEDNFTDRTAPAAAHFFDTCGLKAREVHAVGISVNPNFDLPTKNTLLTLNGFLRDCTLDNFIPPLPSNEVLTEPDQVHYTRNTQTHILSNIINHLDNITKN
jgi:hypothetical protein